jgi:pyroglutamyl-peptidase
MPSPSPSTSRSASSTPRAPRSAAAAAARQRRAALPRVLVTGFEAFGDDPGGKGLNPSALAALALQGKQLAGHTVVAAVLPCVFGESVKVLRALVSTHQPALIVCVGQAGGRAGISIERVAVNLDDNSMPDNAGRVRLNTPVVASGPTAYFSTLPVQAMLAALQTAGVPCELSSSAGHFVCNHVFYALMHLLAKRKVSVCGGFVHVPYLPEQAAALDAPSMPLTELTHGLGIAVSAALTHASAPQKPAQQVP